MTPRANRLYALILDIYDAATMAGVGFEAQITQTIVDLSRNGSNGEVVSMSGNGMSAQFSPNSPSVAKSDVVDVHKLFARAKGYVISAGTASPTDEQIKTEMLGLVSTTFRRHTSDFSGIAS